MVGDGVMVSVEGIGDEVGRTVLDGGNGLGVLTEKLTGVVAVIVEVISRIVYGVELFCNDEQDVNRRIIKMPVKDERFLLFIFHPYLSCQY